MKQIRDIIKEAEARWQTILFRHCEDLFSRVFLPSHDHFHHERVWTHARTLLLLLDKSGISIPASMPEQLLIAVFFHDTGLVRMTGELHGKASRLLCEEFFRQAGPGIRKPETDLLGPTLNAIEHHDDKSLRSASHAIRPGVVPDLLSLLSASDDQDAFGTMGIYRYAEIYILRGVDPEQLPGRVTANVRDRFDNLNNTFGFLDDFIRSQEDRFLQVYEFYLRLSQAYASPNEKPSWEPLLIEIIRNSLAEKENLLNSERMLPQSEFDAEIREWFNALDSENPVTL